MKLLKASGFLPCMFCLFVVSACESLPFQWFGTQSWSFEEGAGPLIHISEISADISGVRTALEKEIAGLAPLVFWEQGFVSTETGETADYEADICIREREYISGWKTRRSLAAEARIWRAGEKAKGALPLAAGRVTSAGDESFSSSKICGRMLSLAVEKAASALRKGEGRP
ncbi:MAG: hypothetical protein LBD71_01315 [Treponema sp.]|jgi:hypothetical protein|nr:hypothetical protein [Treponema sp.]